MKHALYNLLLSLRQELHFFSPSLQDNKYDLFQSFNSKQELLSNFDSPSKRKVDDNQDLIVAKFGHQSLGFEKSVPQHSTTIGGFQCHAIQNRSK